MSSSAPIPAAVLGRTRGGRSAARLQRTTARAVHLVAALALGAFVYAPVEYVEPVRLLLQVLVVPAATLTGLFLWQQAAVRRRLAGLRRRGGAA